jgi:hypothetical protein
VTAPPSIVRLLVRHLAVCLACAVLAVFGLALAGWSPRVGYVLALAVLAAVATLALRLIGEAIVEARWPSPFTPETVTAGVDPRVAGLETLLRRSAEDPAVFERRLRPLLTDLAGHRLRREHGVDPAAQPDLARQLLGDDAWSLLTAPPGSDVPPARIERAITAIEQVRR